MPIVDCNKNYFGVAFVAVVVVVVVVLISLNETHTAITIIPKSQIHKVSTLHS